ncbi:Nucleoporin [Spathaspora sp. JA1]|nr:Nucleoporin [Spathaspora sp. JA1]
MDEDSEEVIYIYEPKSSLIPTHILDQASQRTFLISIFILIQSWKVYDLILFKNDLSELTKFTFLLKYVFLDGGFLWVLTFLHIEYLILTPGKCLVYSLVLYLISWVLVTTSGMFQLGGFSTSELTIIGDSINRDKVIDIESHFKGRLTIHYLPDSSVKMNPFHFDKVCLDGGLYMPVEVNTTTSIGYLQIQHLTSEGTIQYLNYTGKSLNKLLHQDYSHLSKFQQYNPELTYLQYPIEEPGQYKIVKVLDNQGNNIRIYKSEFIITNCPQVKFTYLDRVDSIKCMSDGVSVDDLPQLDILSSIPAVIRVNVRQSGKDKIISIETGKENSWIKPRHLTEQIHINGSSSSIELQLLDITDSWGNVQRYNPESKDKDIWYRLELLPSSKIGLIQPAKDLLVSGEMSLKFNYNVQDYPVELGIEYNRTITSYTFKSKLELEQGVKINQPGEYKLVSARDKHCPCQVDISPIQVSLAQPPRLDIVENSIRDKCLGNIGYDFKFNISGKPPFKIGYQVYLNHTNRLELIQRKSITSHDYTYSFKFKPDTPGSYTIKFVELNDGNYQGIQVKDKTYSTYFNKVSRLGFTNTRTVNTCFGQTSSLPMYFKGNGPFTFKYQFINTSGEVIDSIDVKNVDNYSIITRDLGVTYDVKLSQARDKYGCDAIIDQNKVRIVSRKDIPEVKFVSNDVKYIVEGDSVEIPIQFKSTNGQSKIQVEYTKSGGGTVVKPVTVKGNAIVVNQPGAYKLSSFVNNGCPGVITSNQTVKVMYYARPTMEIVTASKLKQHSEDGIIHLHPVCVGCANEITLKLTGEPPFELDYSIKLPGDVTESHTMNIDTFEIKINLPTRKSGMYEHQFLQLYDGLYTRRHQFKNSVTPKILYQVNELPSGKFIPTDRLLLICQDKVTSDMTVKLPVELTGEYPFDIDMIVNEHQTDKETRIQFNNVHEPYLKLTNQVQFVQGDYSIRFVRVGDSNGCTQTNFNPNDKFIISITQPPNIFNSKQQDNYCVGDYIEYNLTGIPPFTINYQFNEQVKTTQSYFQFKRISNKPGTLSINSIQDSQCKVELTGDKFDKLQIQIHDLPTVEINQGDYIIEDLHQGDQTELIFTFIGTPPFEVTYIRTVTERTHRKVVETKTIKDVYGYELVVPASLEGTYEAVEVRDKYCRAAREIK